MFRKRTSLTTSTIFTPQVFDSNKINSSISLRGNGLKSAFAQPKANRGLQNIRTPGKKRSLSEALDSKCRLEPPTKKAHIRLPLSVIELRASHKAQVCAFKDGKHPALLQADIQNTKLTTKIRRMEEMAQFWKRKSLSLAEDLDRSRTEISMLRNKLENVESERLELQSKLMSAQQDSSQCMKAIQELMAENDNLKFVVKNVNKELKCMQDFEAEEAEKCDVSMAETYSDDPVDMETCKELEEALEDTLADLTDRIEEIEQLKSALARTTVERDELQRVVSREVLQTAIASLDRNTQKNPTVRRIETLQAQVEKCMFRIAVLTQKNEELKKVAIDGSEETDLLRTLEDSQKLEVLESLCQQRYRKLLRKTAARLVETGEDEDLEDESFCL